MRQFFGLFFVMSIFAGPADSQTVQNAAVTPTGGIAIAGIPLSEVFAVPSPLFYFASLPSPNNTVSPRMLAILYPPGAGLSSSAVIQKISLSIRPANSNTEIPIGIARSDSSGYVTFVVPAGVPLGGAELLYKLNDQPTQWTTVNVVQSSFELFRLSSGGPAIADVVAADGSLSAIGLASPTRPGQIVRLTGSGLGYGAAVSATVGGIGAPINYAGPSSTQAGVDEIWFQVPQNPAIPDGCYVPIAITVNQATVNSYLSKAADGSPCRHPFQLSTADLQRLDKGEKLNTLSVAFSTALSAVTSDIASRSDTLSASLGSIGTGDFNAVLAPNSPATGSCALPPARSGLGYAYLAAILSLPPITADIGSSLTLASGSSPLQLSSLVRGFFSQTLPITADTTLSAVPAPTISPGKWTLTTAGGPDLAASSVDFLIPRPLQLNGGAPVSIATDRDGTITWNGVALDPGATVTLYLSDARNHQIYCTAAASSGAVTIPASLLRVFTSNTIGTLQATMTPFIVPGQLKLRNGQTLIVSFSYSSSDTRPVDFK